MTAGQLPDHVRRNREDWDRNVASCEEPGTPISLGRSSACTASSGARRAVEFHLPRGELIALLRAGVRRRA